LTGKIVVALDVMGGDHAPGMVIQGAAIALKRSPRLSFILVGKTEQIEPLLANETALRAASTILHAEDVVTGEDKPSMALRAGRRSSMRLAIDAVVDSKADCIVSAGNTGALMAMAKVALKMLPGIDRPAIAGFFPTQRGESAMLDLGANIDCDADNLIQFALMGDIFARTVLGVARPTIGLLNVGSEDLKGHEYLRQAHGRLRAGLLNLNFQGFVEGDDIGKGTVDVIVTDGFTGNVALKTAEGTVKLFTEFLRAAFKSSLLTRIGFAFAAPALRKLRKRADPRRYNGAVLLGLNGIVVKSHGGADAFGFANAIGVAADMKLNGFLDKMREELDQLATIEIPQTATGG
jgi:glycerol-3-phosphate acyltransferase PlsX